MENGGTGEYPMTDSQCHDRQPCQANVQPEDEGHIDGQPADHGDGIIERAGRHARRRGRITASHGDAVGCRPGQESAEQQDIRERAVGQQMGNGRA